MVLYGAPTNLIFFALNCITIMYAPIRRKPTEYYILLTIYSNLTYVYQMAYVFDVMVYI